MSARLLIVWHSRTGAAEQMAQALAEGAAATLAEMAAADQVAVARQPATLASADDLLHADGYLFCAPENLATVSGEMKAFFDRCYYPVLDRLAGRPYALAVSAGSDGSGAARQMARICAGWRLQAVGDPLIVNLGAQTPAQILAPKKIGTLARTECMNLGGLMAATLALSQTG
ncbi:flavodoxin family protein [Schauerella aestuarii]|uniref:flavodoxin family protein n=1 Tax=Schauerella aestuarii TaxID=2511204 RepID=UPI001368E75D|nr:NAD(P)H-dependent oxidoreductase [Achromobacter aestuarii]MYZ43132.1 flavodoxin family protein [Achromobacter aestuarii]